MKRTSSLVGKTGVLMQDIEEEVTKVLEQKKRSKWQSHTAVMKNKKIQETTSTLEWNRRAK